LRRASALRERARADVQMPLQQYFLFVGGALLILLFATDWVVPQPKGEGIKSEVKLPVIRIYSDRKGPEAVVFDTTEPAFMSPMEQDRAATRHVVASTESSATETVSRPSGSMPEAAEPAKLGQPKAQHREISVGAHARLTRRPLHPAFFASGNPVSVALGSRMREAFARPSPFRTHAYPITSTSRPSSKSRRRCRKRCLSRRGSCRESLLAAAWSTTLSH
jgi:hypothetical protein